MPVSHQACSFQPFQKIISKPSQRIETWKILSYLDFHSGSGVTKDIDSNFNEMKVSKLTWDVKTRVNYFYADRRETKERLHLNSTLP